MQFRRAVPTRCCVEPRGHAALSSGPTCWSRGVQRPFAHPTEHGDIMDVLMPQLGETVAEGKISAWYKSVGEPVKPGDNLFEIETDKVSMEVPAITSGVLAEIRVAAGETAPVGAIVAVIAGSAGATTSPQAAA